MLCGYNVGFGPWRGVDAGRFLATDNTSRRVETLREQLKIPRGALVVGFVGRFTRDKGIAELLDAFEKILCVFPEAWLLLLGSFEEGDPVSLDCVRRLKSHPRVVIVSFVSDTAPY